ncbi:MAG: hypothetical protein M3R15_25435, partial [Acidobacteriota bacterium]|nr:hypothetical protein [Acidobacteriota bacterium]
LTGKRGRNTFGLLVASDNAPGNFGEDARTQAFQDEARRLPGEPQGDIRLLDKNAYIGVLRLKRDVGRESSVGMFATTYNFIEKHNHVLGFDGRFKLDPQTVASFEVVGTSSRNFFYEPALDQNRYRTGNAFAYSLRYQVNKRHYGWNYDGRGRTRDYRTDVGFVQRTNTNRHGIFGFYQSEPQPKAKLISYFVGANVRTHFNWQGQQHEWGYEPQFNLQLAHQTAMGGGYSRDYERIFESEFGPERAANRAGAFFGADNERSTRINTFYYWLESTLTKKVGVEAFLGTRRGAFDFDFGGGRRYPRVSPAALALGENAPLDPGSANALDLNFEVTYKPTNPLNLSLEYTRAKLTRRDTGLTAFDDHIFSLRGTYQFTRFTFARLRVDYDTLASNVRGQYLLGWTPNPGTALFVGYNDSQNYNGFNRFNNDLEPGFRLSNRVFFIKASYLFRKSF